VSRSALSCVARAANALIRNCVQSTFCLRHWLAARQAVEGMRRQRMRGSMAHARREVRDAALSDAPPDARWTQPRIRVVER